MKLIRRSLRPLTFALTVACVLPAAALRAQMPGSPGGVNAALMQLFGANTNFSAKARMTVRDKTGATTISGPVDFAMLDGSVRVDVDLSQLKGSQIPAATGSLKEMGMEKLASIIRADKKEMIVVYPALQAVLVSALSKEEAAALGEKPKVVVTPLGKETLEGVVTEKEKVTVTTGAETREATLWKTAALKDFPIQMETAEQGNTLVMKFSDVKLAKPDAKLFEVPTGFTKYGSPEEMMQGAMKKMMGIGK